MGVPKRIRVVLEDQVGYGGVNMLFPRTSCEPHIISHIVGLVG